MTERDDLYRLIEEDANFRPRTFFEAATGPRPHERAMARAMLIDRDRRERALAEFGTFEEYAARLGREATWRDELVWALKRDEVWEECHRNSLAERLWEAQQARSQIDPIAGSVVALAVIVVVLVGAFVGLLLF